MRKLLRAGAIAALILAAGPAAALEVTAAGDTRWVTGGVSQEERLDMLMLLPEYNLRIVSAAEKSGAYLADARVVVKDAGGRVVLDTVLEGPFLLASLAPGKYELQATHEGKVQVRTLTIPASGRRELFLYWVVPGAEADEHRR